MKNTNYLTRSNFVIALVLLQLAVVPRCEAENKQQAKIPFPALITACRASAYDKYLKDSPTLLLIFPVGAQYSTLYEQKNDGAMIGLADMHYDEGGLDAQGGVWSINRASDVYDYLSSKSFRFFKSKEELESSKYLQKPEECKIRYKNLNLYEKS